MEIIVQGKGTEFFTPNEVILNIGFHTKGQSYEEVLSEGCPPKIPCTTRLIVRVDCPMQSKGSYRLIVA